MKDIPAKLFPGLFQPKLQKRVHPQVHGQPVIRIQRIILRRLRPHIRRTHCRIPGNKIRKTAGESMLSPDLHHWFCSILPQLQLPKPVDTEKPAKYLPHIIEHIPTGFNITLFIDRKDLPAIRHSFNRLPALCQFHLTGLTAQHHKIIGISHRLKAVEPLIKPQHKIIRPDLQTFHSPVRFRHLKDPHWYLFIAAISQPQMVR